MLRFVGNLLPVQWYADCTTNLFVYYFPSFLILLHRLLRDCPVLLAAFLLFLMTKNTVMSKMFSKVSFLPVPGLLHQNSGIPRFRRSSWMVPQG